MKRIFQNAAENKSSTLTYFGFRRVFVQGRVKGAFSTRSIGILSVCPTEIWMSVRVEGWQKFGRNFFNPENFPPRAVYCAVRSFKGVGRMSNGRIVDRRWRCSRALSCKHCWACHRWISIRRVLKLCVNSPGLRDDESTARTPTTAAIWERWFTEIGLSISRSEVMCEKCATKSISSYNN